MRPFHFRRCDVTELGTKIEAKPDFCAIRKKEGEKSESEKTQGNIIIIITTKNYFLSNKLQLEKRIKKSEKKSYYGRTELQ